MRRGVDARAAQVGQLFSDVAWLLRHVREELDDSVPPSIVPILLALKEKPLTLAEIARRTALTEKVVESRIRDFRLSYGKAGWVVRSGSRYSLSKGAHAFVDRVSAWGMQTETLRELERLRRVA